VDNTSDADKPVSTAQQWALDNKADKDTDAVVGNFASFDASGNPIDSGKKDADYEDADDTILKKAQVKDNLTSTNTDLPLSANQGKVLKDGQDELAGAGRTTETVKGNAEDIATLNADDATEGSVLKSIKDEAENAKFTPTTESGIESMTIEEAVNEVGVGLDEHKSAIMPHIFQDLSTGKKYRYGFQLSAEGNPQTISEEIL
jgi:hypothetical protein